MYHDVEWLYRVAVLQKLLIEAFLHDTEESVLSGVG
jgi:hypothetical protein